MKVKVGFSSAHHIDLEIDGGVCCPRWRLTGFYGWPRTADRNQSWQLLKDLSDRCSLPWVVIGDFNEILHSGEKQYGPQRLESQMRGFREALGYGDLLDLGFSGPATTWWNSETLLRLDRAVCTPAWCDLFGHARLQHLLPSDSDHLPILLRASTVPIAKRPRIHRFKFEAHWLQQNECDDVVKEAWSTEVIGFPMFQVTRKIKFTRLKLDAWQKTKFHGRQLEMLGIRERLEVLLGAGISEAIVTEKKDLSVRLQKILSEEETFWRQRAKVMWLKDGDRNIGYFHRKASNRKRKNHIKGLYDSSGKWVEEDDDMERVVSSYFKCMFTAEDIDMEAMHTTLNAISPCITNDMNNQLCALYSEDEIRTVLFQMYPTK